MNAVILIDFGDRDDGRLVVENIKYVAQTQGLTYKRLFLLGVASYMQQTGQNPELIEQIASYLAIPRKNSRRS